MARQRITELEIEANTHLKALDKAKEWRERQIKELTEQKDIEIQKRDNEIEELKKKITQLELNQNQQLEAKIEVKSSVNN